MKITPPDLNLALERKNFFGFKIIAACAGVTAFAAFFDIPFAIAFAASASVVLPIMLLLLFPSVLSSRFRTPGGFGLRQIAVYLLFFSYIAIAKKVIVPFIIGIFEHVLP
jgi:hypothetical protein